MAKAKYRRKSKLDPFESKIGILPDKVIGDLAGVTSENVRAFRNRRGISARWRGEDEPFDVEEVADEVKSTSRLKKRRSRLVPPAHTRAVLDELPPEPILGEEEVETEEDIISTGSYVDPAEEAAMLVGSDLFWSDSPPEVKPTAEIETTSSSSSPFWSDNPDDDPFVYIPPAATPPVPAAENPVYQSRFVDGAVQAFIVTVEANGEQKDYVSIGQDIAKASALAVDSVRNRDPRARVIAIKYLAEALIS